MIILALIVLYAIIEALHDLAVIKGNSNKWHSLGMIQNALFFIPLFWLADFRIVIAGGLVFWQLHDSLLGYFLHKNIFYLGQNKIDNWISEVFGGVSFFIIRIITSALFIYDYSL